MVWRRVQEAEVLIRFGSFVSVTNGSSTRRFINTELVWDNGCNLKNRIKKERLGQYENEGETFRQYIGNLTRIGFFMNMEPGSALYEQRYETARRQFQMPHQSAISLDMPSIDEF